MSWLSAQLVQYLWQESNLKSIDKLIDLLLRWTVLVDFEVIREFLQETLEYHIEIGYANRGITSWQEVQYKSPPRIRQEFVSWVLEPIIDRGFECAEEAAEPEQKVRVVESELVIGELSLSLKDLKDAPYLAEQLLKLTPDEAIEVLFEAVYTWAWYQNSQQIISEIRAQRRDITMTDWRHPNLVHFIFYCLYEDLVNLNSQAFDDKFLEKWRS